MKHIVCLRELVLLASLVLVTSLMSGEVKSEPSVLERKIEILDQSGLEGLEESLLSEPETWVRLTSRTVVGASTSESRSYGTLVNKLRMKVESIDPRSFRSDYQQLSEFVIMMDNIATPLERSGGYVDWVLAVSIRRRMLAGISSFVSHSPEQVNEVISLTERIEPPYIDYDTIEALKFEEESITHRRIGDAKRDRETLLRLWNADRVYSNISSSGARLFDVETLAGSGDVNTLVWLADSTYREYKINLNAFLQYLRKGGSLDDLRKFEFLDEFVQYMGMEWYHKFIIDNDVATFNLLNVTRLYYTFGLNKQDEESFINPSVFLMEAEE